MVCCAKCGKELGFFEKDSVFSFQNALKYGLFSEYKEKTLCHSCIFQLLDSKGIKYRGLMGQRQSLKRIQELTKDRKTCYKCGYFEEVRHDIGGVNSSGIILSDSYSTFKCRKFSFDLNEKDLKAEKCTSYILKEDYQEKCLSGEMDKEKAKENVQVVFDFSSLKDELAKGGVVMTTCKCPNCNAMVDIPETGKVLICKYCGTPIKAVDIFEKIKSLISGNVKLEEQKKEETKTYHDCESEKQIKEEPKQEYDNKPDWYKEALKQHQIE
jgi:hypothetical protein